MMTKQEIYEPPMFIDGPDLFDLPNDQDAAKAEWARRWRSRVDAVLNALPLDTEPSRCHLSDLVSRTGLPAATVESVLLRLQDAGLLIVDSADSHPNHPAGDRYFHAGRIFVRRA